MSEPGPPPEPLNWPKIGSTIRLMRHLLRRTQAELAEGAGIDRASVQRLEKGKAVRVGTLRKICLALGVNFNEIRRLSLSYGPPEGQECVRHHAENSVWHGLMDRRSRIPGDNDVRTQDAAERRRLGSLGLVPRFRSYLDFIMMAGPGIFIVEVYGRHDDWHATNEGSVYQDWIMYCLRGTVRMWRQDTFETLTEGSAIGFRSGFRFQLEAAPTDDPSTPPPQVMFVGANRR